MDEVTKKILIIDDSKIIRLEVKRIVEESGIEAMELDNAEDFLQMPWFYRDIHLLLLDIELPGINGIIALEQIRKEPSWDYLPVIILSGTSDRETVQRAIKAGAIGFVTKPFSREQLLERIKKVLSTAPEPPAETSSIVEREVRLEISRAKRSKTAVSFLEIEVPTYMRSFTNMLLLETLRGEIVGQLREIDNVLVTRERNFFIILPLTDNNGAEFVVRKLRKYSQIGQDTPIAVVTYPTNGLHEKVLLEGLKQQRQKLADVT